MVGLICLRRSFLIFANLREPDVFHGDLPPKNLSASTGRFRAVEECGSSLARRSELARIIRACNRGVYRVVLLRTASFIQPNRRPSLPVLSRTEEPVPLYHQCTPSRREAARL